MTQSTPPRFSNRARPQLLGLALAATGALAACSPSTVAMMSTPDGGVISSAVTYHKDIEPIVQKHCQKCHSPGRIAPFSMASYSDLKPFASLMAVRTMNRTMPPFGAAATSTCKPRFGWKDDPTLTDAEIALINQWAQAGAPEGDIKDAPPPYQLPVDGLPGVQQELTPRQPFLASGNNDLFRCFVLDPALKQPAFLNGWHVVAGNPQVVHHALVFANPSGSAAAMADASGGYDCFGGPGVSDAQLIAAWAPGSVPAELPSNIATTIKPGTLFVMQIHYHPAGRTNLAPDSTKFQMRFIASPPEWELLTSLIGNFASYDAATGDGLQPDENGQVKFVIPANAPAKEIDQVFTIPAKIGNAPTPEFRAYSVGTHMHYVGQDMAIQLQRGPTIVNNDPASECLIETPHWDFHWQRWYVYDASIDALPRVHAGDKIKMKCVYNNTMSNPALVEALAEQGLNAPRDVSLGERTLDEMCLGVFGSLYKP